jgi:hypothetical protein
LTPVVGIVLHEVGHHVHHATRHAVHARSPRHDGRLEQTRENLRGFAERALRLDRRRAKAIERPGARPRSTHSREHTPHALHVRNDGCY